MNLGKQKKIIFLQWNKKRALSQLLTVIYSLIGPDMVKRHNSFQEREKDAANSILPVNKRK